MSTNDGVAVVGVGIHPFGRHPGVSGLEMAAVAARAALTDAGIGWPEVDFAAGGSARNWIKVLSKVAKRHRDAVFIFGHAKAGAPVTGPAKELEYFRDYLSRVVDIVQKGVKAKKSKEELVKTIEVPGFPDHVSSGQVLTLAGILGSIYDEITAK